MRATSYWNDDKSVCVLRFDRSVERIGQCPFNAVNYALETFYNQSKVCDPFPVTIWDTPTTQWGILVAEAMDLSDEQAFALAQSVTTIPQTSPAPYTQQSWEF